jgi:hypothetical protein
MKKVANVVRDKRQQYEGLRTSLGMLLEAFEVRMFILHHEVVALAGKESDPEAYEEYADNMAFIDDMEGERYSDNQENIAKHGFRPATLEQTAAMLNEADLVVPF